MSRESRWLAQAGHYRRALGALKQIDMECMWENGKRAPCPCCHNADEHARDCGLALAIWEEATYPECPPKPRLTPTQKYNAGMALLVAISALGGWLLCAVWETF